MDKLSKAISIVLVCGMLAPTLTQAGIPVVDVVGNMQELEHWTARLQQWQQTVTQYKSQLNAYKDQLATAVGVRQIGDFVNQAKSLKGDLQNLQKNGVSLNDLLTSSGSLSGELNSIYQKYSMFDNCNSGQSASYKEVCKQIVVNKALAVEQTQEVQDMIADKLESIANLSTRIENSQDSKESQDLANSVSLQTVQLNTLTSQWEMTVKQSEMRDKLLQSKREAAFKEQQRTAAVPTFN